MPNKIITISREFGSGGRELGKRLAEELNIAYYDKEILKAIAQKTQLAEEYVEAINNSGLHNYYPISYGLSFSNDLFYQNNNIDIIVEQNKIIKELAQKGDCVIVGRNADLTLSEYKPFNVFVYSDIENSLKRCRERDSETLSDEQIIKNIKKINKGRKKNREIASSVPWGNKDAYDICINTSNVDIKDVIKPLAEISKSYFNRKQ